MILPVRTKSLPRSKLQFFCPGDGCGARLAVQTIHEDGRPEQVCLEPRYINDPHPPYPAGTWWRQERGGYKGMPRARDARRAMRDIDRATEGVPPEAVAQVIKQTLKRGDLLDNAYTAPLGRLTGSAGARLFRESTEFRNRDVMMSRGKLRGNAAALKGRDRRHAQPRPALPPGIHTIVCYQCGGKASIELPIPGNLLPRS